MYMLAHLYAFKCDLVALTFMYPNAMNYAPNQPTIC